MNDYIFFLIPIIFVPVFIGLWVGIVKLLSVFGWRKFADRQIMRGDAPLNAEKIGMQSMMIRTAALPINYNNCINGWIGRGGFFLQPVWAFRMFHPLLHFTWGEIRDVEPFRRLGFKRYRLTFREELPTLIIFGKLGQAIFDNWSKQAGRSPRGE